MEHHGTLMNIGESARLWLDADSEEEAGWFGRGLMLQGNSRETMAIQVRPISCEACRPNPASGVVGFSFQIPLNQKP